MTAEQLDQKFNLIGDPIVRAVVRHLYDAEFIPNDVCELISQAETVLLRGFDWNKSNLSYGFFSNLYLHLIHNSNYSFTPEEFKLVQNAYPELFNADGSLKGGNIKDDATNVSEVLKQHAEYANDIKNNQKDNAFDNILCAVVSALVPRYPISQMGEKAKEIVQVAAEIYEARNEYLKNR